MKVLVTGATGFAGNHLARTLMAGGYQVRALVRPGKRGRRLADAGIETFEGQLTNATDVHRAAEGCARIYHLAAAFRSVANSDQMYWDVNVGGTLNVLAAATRARLRTRRALLHRRRTWPHRSATGQ